MEKVIRVQRGKVEGPFGPEGCGLLMQATTHGEAVPLLPNLSPPVISATLYLLPFCPLLYSLISFPTWGSTIFFFAYSQRISDPSAVCSFLFRIWERWTPCSFQAFPPV